MKIGVALPTRTWPENRIWPAREMVAYGEKADALGFDSLWASDHYFLGDNHPGDIHPGRGVGRTGSPDPLVLLSNIAARTRRILLGTLVLCSVFRSPGQVAREARALAELSGGRFILGIGAGGDAAEFEALGVPLDHRTSRFAEYLDALCQLFKGGPVHYSGEYVQLNGLEVSGESVPPIWIGGTGPRMLRLAARHAAGWNGGGRDELFAELIDRLRREEISEGRVPGSVVVSRRALVLIVGRKEHVRLLSEHPYIGDGVLASDLDQLVELAKAYRQAGCEHLILHFSGTLWSNYSPAQLELAASVLPRMRGDDESAM